MMELTPAQWKDREKWIELNAIDAIILCRDCKYTSTKDIKRAEEKMELIIKSNDRWSLKKLIDLALSHHDDDCITFRRDEE